MSTYTYALTVTRALVGEGFPDPRTPGRLRSPVHPTWLGAGGRSDHGEPSHITVGATAAPQRSKETLKINFVYIQAFPYYITQARLFSNISERNLNNFEP